MALQALVDGPGYAALGPLARRIVATAVVLHDIGKPATTRHEAGKLTSRGHSARGEILARAALWHLGAPFAVREHKGPARMPGAGAVNIAGATIAVVDRVAGHEPVVVVPAGALPPGASPTSVAPWVMLPASKGHVRSANATARRRHRHLLRRRRRQGRDRHGP